MNISRDEAVNRLNNFVLEDKDVLYDNSYEDKMKTYCVK